MTCVLLSVRGPAVNASVVRNRYGGMPMALIANRYWILLALFAGATVSYSIGFMVGVGLFIAAGLVFELAFWHQLIRRSRRL
jgi:hypothetical protein